MRIALLLAVTAVAGFASSGQAATVSLICPLSKKVDLDSQASSSDNRDTSGRGEVYTFHFDSKGDTADIERDSLDREGAAIRKAWTAHSTATPSTMIFSFRDSRSANVFVDYRFAIDRAALNMSGSVVMPGWMNIQVESQCKMQKADTSRNKF